MAEQNSHKVVWLDEYCEYCGKQLNSWDNRIAKVLYYKFPVCEECIADEYGMTREYLRDRMLDRFGMRPCEGI